MAVNDSVSSEYLQSLENFISESYSSLKLVADTLGWNINECDSEVEMVSCPLNAEHRIPKCKLDNHLKRCKWRQDGYSDSDVPLPDNCEQDNSVCSIVIDKKLQGNILSGSSISDLYAADHAKSEDRSVPQTADRIICDFTPSERLALYNYAVANTQPPALVKTEELHIMYKKDEESRPKSKLELLMEIRDAKRRRISYRSKKVHTNRKSHLEILREVIQNQMDFLEELNKPETEENQKNESTNSNIDETLEGKHKIVFGEQDKDIDKKHANKYLEDDKNHRSRSPKRNSHIVSNKYEMEISKEVEDRSRKRHSESCYDYKKLKYSKESSYYKEKYRSENADNFDKSRRRSKSREPERAKERKLDFQERISYNKNMERYWDTGPSIKYFHKSKSRGTKRDGSNCSSEDEVGKYSKKMKYLKEESCSSVGLSGLDIEYRKESTSRQESRNQSIKSQGSSEKSRHSRNKSSKSRKHKHKKKKKRHKSSLIESDKLRTDVSSKANESNSSSEDGYSC